MSDDAAAPTTCPRCGAAAVGASARFCHACGQALPAPDVDPLVGRAVLGRYVVERLIGRGGMGRVYLAEQRIGRAARKVAVKVLSPTVTRDPSVAARFRHEAATILRLTHPSTVRLYDFGEEDGQLMLVMEYIAGERLAEVLDRGPLPLARATAIAVQIAGSLDEAHRLGVVHRDLKPENVILMTSDGDTQLVKVVDFGVAKHVDQTVSVSHPAITASGTLVGTPAYMAPEQFAGLPVDARTDVYALGLLSYQMLAGALPWTAKNVYEWATYHVKEPPPALESRAPGLPPRVYAAVHHALAKLPDERPASTAEFVRELTGLPPGADAWAALVGSEVARAEPPPPPGRAVSLRTLAARAPAPPRRHWALFAALFVAAVAIGYGVVALVARGHLARGPGGRAGGAGARDAGAGAARAVDAAVPSADASADPDASAARPNAAPHPNAARADRAVEAGLARARADNVVGALEALETAQDLVGPAAPALAPLRDALAPVAARALRTRLAARRCPEAQALLRRVRRVGAEGRAYELFNRGCALP